MQLSDILPLFACHPGVTALAERLQEGRRTIEVDGLHGSSPAVVLAAAALPRTYLIILSDEEEAGYFYNDMVHLVGDSKAILYPSGYRRAVKYGQRDAANEILRTDVLTRLSRRTEEALYVVTSP